MTAFQKHESRFGKPLKDVCSRAMYANNPSGENVSCDDAMGKKGKKKYRQLHLNAKSLLGAGGKSPRLASEFQLFGGELAPRFKIRVSQPITVAQFCFSVSVCGTSNKQ
ncbi:hypothetical protein CEXT_807731 [Caerostris extrusa]|uniref:Uncharacterized protein n=1 Tax=Caerostris extrusa TaxID=172846 RepID=A0AAV4V6J0_CAEEX|nr:hypothetical protein CEXT_807731 [Caerostris extrusa]